tara:strand:- start:167 stop:418 length:252 start_codon:yes stop_codon:yes gene_type:complete
MQNLLTIRIVSIFYGLFLIVFPVLLQASGLDSFRQEIDLGKIVEAPKQMTQKQMNELFGEDPYLGQTSYLQSPDGFSQREKSK